MTDRIDALMNLIRYETEFTLIANQLNEYEWDSEEELVTLYRNDIIAILKKFLSNILTSQQVGVWADVIEGREDIGYEKGFESLIADVIFQLSTPEISRKLGEAFAKSLISRLENWSS